MNSDLLNIITTGGGDVAQGGIASNASSSFPTLSHGDDDGVDDLLSPRPRSLEDKGGFGGGSSTTNYFGLNLGRSQSAAPETWGTFAPSAHRGSGIDGGVGDGGGGLFGTRPHTARGGSQHRFFDEEEEDREALMQAGMRRPASTGIIGRPSLNGVGGGGADGDVNSILETLGLTSLEDNGGMKGSGNNLSAAASPFSTPISTPKVMGGIDSSGSLVMGAHTPGKSIMEKIHEASGGGLAGGFGGPEPEDASGNVVFSGSSHGGSQISLQSAGAAPSIPSAQQYQVEQQHQYQGGLGQQLHANQYLQQQQQQSQYSTPQKVQYNQDSLHFDPQQQQQQQVYYQQQLQTSQPYHTQDYRAQQAASLNMMHGAPPQQQQQQTIYHINAPAPAYGYEYHHAQPHQAHLQHVLLPHQQVAAPGGAPHGQPQYISIVPIHAPPPPAHHHNGHHTYAYVQYSDGSVSAQPTLVATSGAAPAATAFVMGPNGPIAVAAPSHVVPVHAMGYGGGHHGSSPPGTGSAGRSPVRTPMGGGGMSMKTPDRTPGSGRKKNPMSSPRGKRVDKNAPVPSKLGPEATILLQDIRAAKSRNQWTIHDIKGHVVEFCLDQNGSRFIQQRLEVADPEEKDAVMDEIIPAIKDLQNDVFGNYVVQKLYEFGTESMKRGLKGTLEGNMLLLSLQMYG